MLALWTGTGGAHRALQQWLPARDQAQRKHTQRGPSCESRGAVVTEQVGATQGSQVAHHHAPKRLLT